MIIDHSELTQEAFRSGLLNERWNGEVQQNVAEGAQRIIADGKIQMPVDTGAARARWGTLYNELDGGMTVEVGAELDPYEYIEALNEGHSMQAPAGFIDAIGLREAERLADYIADDLVDAFIRS